MEVRSINVIDTQCNTPNIYDAGVINHRIVSVLHSYNRNVNGIKTRRNISDIKMNVPTQDILTKTYLDIGKMGILQLNTF